jgi:hypothetical protein
VGHSNRNDDSNRRREALPAVILEWFKHNVCRRSRNERSAVI